MGCVVDCGWADGHLGDRGGVSESVSVSVRLISLPRGVRSTLRTACRGALGSMCWKCEF
jgi:hypothetical protein